MKSTAKSDRLQNNRATSRLGITDRWVDKGLDELERYRSQKRPWEYWFDYGDELV